MDKHAPHTGKKIDQAENLTGERENGRVFIKPVHLSIAHIWGFLPLLGSFPRLVGEYSKKNAFSSKNGLFYFLSCKIVKNPWVWGVFFFGPIFPVYAIQKRKIFFFKFPVCEAASPKIKKIILFQRKVFFR